MMPRGAVTPVTGPAVGAPVADEELAFTGAGFPAQ